MQVDGIATRKKQDGDEQDTFIVSTDRRSVPRTPTTGRASGSRRSTGCRARRPGSGDFWTRVEANLFPLDGTTAPTLNQLYVRLGDWLIVGKTYSTFMDDGALPTTLDYNGPSGVTFVRQWLARASIPFAHGLGAPARRGGTAGGLERGRPAGQRASRARAGRTSRRASATRAIPGTCSSPGSRAASTSPRQSPFGTRDRHVNGTGVSFSGSVDVFGDDTLLWQAVTGKGVGRYFNDPLSSTGVALGSDRRFELVRSSGVTLYYQHKWAPDWMTVAGASTLWISTDGLRQPDELKRVIYASANLAASPHADADRRRRSAMGRGDPGRRRIRDERAACSFRCVTSFSSGRAEGRQPVISSR